MHLREHANQHKVLAQSAEAMPNMLGSWFDADGTQAKAEADAIETLRLSVIKEAADAAE